MSSPPSRSVCRRSAARGLFGGEGDEVGLDVEAARAPKSIEPRQGAGQGNPVRRFVGHARRGDRQRGTRQIRPVRFLALAADESLHVETPAVESRIEAQGRERNGDLRRPAIGRPSSLYRPHTVPLRVDVAPLVGDQCIVASAVRIGGEGEGVAAVQKRVEHQNEGIVGGELRVALHLLGDDLPGRPIERAQRHVERRGRIGDGELRPFGSRRSFAGLALPKVCTDFGASPRGLVEPTVDDDRLVDCERRDRGALGEIGIHLTDRRRTECQRDDE